MTVIRRSAWNRTPPSLSRLKTAERYTRLTIHHAGALPIRHTIASMVARDLNSILSAHMDHHYGDIAYHLVVDYAGRVWEGRSLRYEGAHVLSENDGNVGVMLLGNFERQRPSPAQLTVMGDLTELLRLQFGIRRSRVYGHRDLSPSMCPGRNLYPYVSGLRQDAAG